MDNHIDRSQARNEEIKKKVRVFEYKWIDDHHYNLGYKELKEKFIGTKEEFQEYRKMEEWGQGFSCWDIVERKPTKEELAYLEEE